jgi:hypothetical protein
MASIVVDVEAQVENLRGIKTDLEEWYRGMVEAGETSVRFPLGMAIGQLAQRIAALEEIVRQHGDEVYLGPLTVDESRNIDRALDVLDGEIVREPATKLWPRVRSVLVAADDLLLSAARGEPAANQHPNEHAPRSGVVLPLIRSSN